MTRLPLLEWRDFFATVGTAAGVIIGATFIVVTLVSQLKDARLGLRGFVTPTAFHLGMVLIVCAVLTIPALSPMIAAIFLMAGGAGGTIYAVLAAVRIWHMKLDTDDRIFYAVLPVFPNAAVTAAGVFILWPAAPAFAILAGALLLLLVIGMRNSWDMASFVTTGNPRT